MRVRPLHPTLYLLGLGHRLSPIGLGRVVTVPHPANDRLTMYRGDGPSLGWVTERLLPIWIEHDRRYRHEDVRGRVRMLVDHAARAAVIRSGVPSLARYRLAWRLADPLLRLAWRYRWGGWQDLPRWLWWSCLAVWAALWFGGWAGLGWLLWRIA